MDSGQKKEAWKRLAYYYRQALGRQYPPSQEHLHSIATNWAELYRCRLHEGLQVPIMAMLEVVEDGILGEEEVTQAVRSLKRGRSGGSSGMRAKDLK